MDTQRRYLTHDDIPNLLTPCYITSTGELYQWSNRKQDLIKKTVFYDKTHDKAVVNVAVTTIKNGSRSLSVATYVYRYFSGEENLPKQTNLGYKDGDPMNCNIDNLYIRTDRYNKNPRFRRTATGRKVRVKPEDEVTNKFGLQIVNKRLVLEDFDSVMLFLDMRREHRERVLADTQLTIDTTDWTAEQLRKLLKMRARLGDSIIK